MRTRSFAVLAVAALALSTVPIASAAAEDDDDTVTLIGHSFLFTAGPIPVPGVPPLRGVTFVLKFADASHMTFTQVGGPTGFGPPCENETVHVTKIKRSIYFVRWIESTGVSISHVDDIADRHAVVSSVVPTTLTSQQYPLPVSFSGTLRPYHGKPLPACAQNGSGQ